MHKENVIISYEERGREKMRRLCETLNYDYENNSDITEHFDGTLHYHGKNYLIEVKDRNIKFKDYPTIMYEQYKDDALKEAVEQLGANGAFYVCFYDNEAFIFNVYDDDVQSITPTNVPCNKYTAFDGGKVEKSVYLLPKRLARKYTVE